MIYLIPGFLLFFPIEIYPGFYLSYIAGIFLLKDSTFSLRLLFVYFCLCIFVLISLIVNQSSFITAINSLYCALFFCLKNINIPSEKSFKLGMLLGIILLGLLYFFALQNVQINLITILSDRTWARDFNPLHGNWITLVGIIIPYLFNSNLVNITFLFSSLLSGGRLFVFQIIAWIISRKSLLTRVIIYILLFIFIYLVVLKINYNFLALDGSLYQRLSRIDDRVLVVQESISIISQNIFFGIGSGEYGSYGHAHNSIIHTFVKFGLVPGTLYAILIFTFIFRIKYLSLVFFLLLSSLFQLTFHVPSVIILSALLLKQYPRK